MIHSIHGPIVCIRRHTHINKQQVNQVLPKFVLEEGYCFDRVVDISCFFIGCCFCPLGYKKIEVKDLSSQALLKAGKHWALYDSGWLNNITQKTFSN